MTVSKDLALPEGYNAGTALKLAFLKIKETVDKNGKNALEVCTTDSVSRSLLDMCIQGLDPSKRQCYFIVYGNQLSLFRSYFGTQAALRRAVPSVYKIVTDLVHHGDQVEWAVSQFGERYVSRIVTDPFTNMDKPVSFGYCNIFDKDGNILGSTLMSWEQIQTSWKKTRTGGATQKEFPEEMAKRTLINRASKHILNSSIESIAPVVAAFNQTTDNEYERVEVDKPQIDRKQTFKEKYGIKPETVLEAEVEEPQNGPEAFVDTPFIEQDTTPKSKGLFDGMEDVPF